MQALFSLLFVIISLIGLADASYISYEIANYMLPPCSQGFDCAAVLTSQYAKIGSVSVANLGAVYYLVMLILAILHYIEFDFSKINPFKKGFLSKIETFDVLLLISAGGFLFSLYLLSLMAFVIKSWCIYCLISATTSTTLFVLLQIYQAKLRTHSSFLAKGLALNTMHWLYGLVAKPFFFLINPELVHETMTKLGKIMGYSPLLQLKTRWLFQFRHPVLSKTLNGIVFPGPVGLSAGYDYDGNLTQIMADVGFGFQTVGTVTLQAYQGNTGSNYRRFPSSKSLLVNKGLKNSGAKAIIQKLTGLKFRIPVGISIASTNKSFSSDKEQMLDILQCFQLFESSKVQHSFYELNISCPNTFGGEPFTIPERLEPLLTALDSLKLSKPLFVKMPIDQSEKETLQLLKVIDKHNTQGIIIGNLTKDKSNPAVTSQDREAWKQHAGNLSGKPTFERSNKLIALAKKHYGQRFTIIGTGGIFSPEDAQEKMKRGADLVQLITGMIFEGPELISLINLGLADQALDKRSDKVG